MAGVATLDNLLWVLQPLCEAVAVERRDAMVEGMLAEIEAGMGELACPQEKIDSFSHWLTDHLQVLSNNDRAYLAEDERPEIDTEMNVLDDIVLTTNPVEELEPVDAQFVEQLKGLTEGTWVEIAQDNKEPLRCKLATITQPGSNYVFVNRRGMKVFESSRPAVASLLEDEQLKLIDESQVFDRALQSVIGNLRQMQRDRS